MSDYEGEGWTSVELSTQSDLRGAAADKSKGDVAPPFRFTAEDLAKNLSTARRDRDSLAPKPAESLYPVIQRIRPRVHHGTGGRPVNQAVPSASNRRELEAYKLFVANPNTPNDVYELDVSWRELLRAIPETPDSNPREVALASLDSISELSEAFVKTPESNSLQIEIWGKDEQCQKAKARLQAWESYLRSTGQRHNRKGWLKEHAFDGRKEDRKRQAEWQEWEEKALQEADDADFAYEVYLVWPKDYDLEAYVEKYEPTTLKDIAKEFACRFKHERKARQRITKIQARSEGNLISAYQRLINLAKEMTSTKNRGTHGNFCHPPSFERSRNRVTAEQVANDRKAPYRTILVGEEAVESDVERWLDLMKLYSKQNRVELRSSISSFIKSLHVSQCHVKLRVSFGDVLLQQFPLSKAISKTFEFYEFLEMIQGRRTEFSEPMLPDVHGNMALLVDKLAAMEQFGLSEEAYRQVFEFKGTDATNRLRLEIEMQPGYDFDEPQVCSQRWLNFKTYGQNENVLGLWMLDFERPGFMIRADAYDLFTNDKIIKEMEIFRSAVSFKPSRDGVKAYPRLRSTFAGHNKLVSVTEYTSTKFHFKNTDGIIEVRREDTYRQDTGHPSKLPDRTKFEVLYYYPEWDNLLGELSSIKPGEDVSWSREITTFFPNHIDPDRPRALPKGFKTFVKELHEIQDSLAEALSSLDDREAK